MTQRLELALLGSPEVRLGGTPVTGFRSAKTQALLYYLAATGRPQPRSTLAGLFWAGVGDYYARRNLNRTLSNLTQLVGDHLVKARETLALDRSQPYWFDVELLENTLNAASTAGDEATLQEALELYRGEFLAGFYIHDAPEFEQWVLAERTRLNERYLQGLQTLAHLLAGRGDLTGASTAVRRALQLEPWREEAHRQLMLLLAQSGQRSAALAQFELCRQALATELDAEPEPATLDLVARIRAGEFAPPGDSTIELVTTPAADLPHQETPPAPQPPPHNLPVQTTPFVGRATELAEIARLLDDPDCRLLTLVGPGGIGKTRLALQSAGRMVAEQADSGVFPQGIFFVPLDAVRDGDGILSAIISAIAEESGFPLSTGAPLREQLLDFLRPKELLLVLDNFEHLQQQATLLSAILTAAPAVKILVTSREMIALQEAWSYSIEGLSVPPAGDGPEVAALDHDAVRLFVQCARRVQPGFSLAAEQTAVIRICQIVEGMPLAIELAATWLKLLRCDQIAAEIERGLDFLAARYQNIPERHRSMRAVLEHSWRLLGPEERTVAARLSVFRGSFNHEAATAVAGASLPMIALLVEKALLRVRPDGSYQMHELTRQYAGEQVERMGELRNAHSDYYANLAGRLKTQMFGPQSKAALDEFTAAFDNLLSAWRWILQTIEQGQADPRSPTWLAQLVPAFAEYYYAKARFEEGRQTFERAAQTLAGVGWPGVLATGSAPSEHQTVYAQLQVRISMLCCEMGEHKAVVAQFERDLPLLQAWNDAGELALAFALAGKAHYRRGQRAEARTLLQQSLHYAQSASDLLGQAIALNNLSHLAEDEGNYEETERLLRSCLTIYEGMGYAPGIGATLCNLGFLYELQGLHEKALAHVQQSLAIAEEQDDPGSVMINIYHIAEYYRTRGRIQEALAEYRRSEKLAHRLGQLRWLALNLTGLATIYAELHDVSRAIGYVHEALTLSLDTASVTTALNTLALLANIWARQGKIEPTLRLLVFVTRHPSTTAVTRGALQELLNELVAEIAPSLVAQAETWATTQTLDEVVAWATAQSPDTSAQKLELYPPPPSQRTPTHRPHRATHREVK
jgi:predicted ATPase/DNA-binding SARP family transcriptional activator